MTNQTEIAAAYRYCQALAHSHYENFPVASLLLPKHLRQPICVIYAFARTADDIADEGTDDRQQRITALASYQQAINQIQQGQYQGQSPIFIALNEVVNRFKLPIKPFHDLLSAFEQDVSQQRYQTDHDLIDYCRRSANPIGHLLLYLSGKPSQQQLDQADAACTALQLLNFYQDIKQDWQENNRLYLSLDALQRHGLTEDEINNDDTSALAPILRERYHYIATLLFESLKLGESLSGRLGWEIRTITLMGLFTLKQLCAQNDNKLATRPRLSTTTRYVAAMIALIKPLYRHTSHYMLKPILK